MYLLYADDSGVASDPNVKYSVLAGFATFENQTFWIQKAIDDIMLKHTGRADLELHASPIRSGKGIWRGFTKDKRESILTPLRRRGGERPRSGLKTGGDFPLIL